MNIRENEVKVIKPRDLGCPPGCCPDCWNHQQHHPYDIECETYYCPHNGVWAIVKSDYSGWQIQTGVTRKQVEIHMDSAAQLSDVYLSRRGSLN